MPDALEPDRTARRGDDPHLDEIVREFVAETQEAIQELDHGLVALERDVGDDALLARLLRGMHTIKGNSGFFGFRRVQVIAHATESVLSVLANGGRVADRGVIDTLLAAGDTIDALLEGIKASGGEPALDVGPLLMLLTNCTRSGGEIGPIDPAAMRSAVATRSTVRVDVRRLHAVLDLVTELAAVRDLLHVVGASGDGPLGEALARLDALTEDLGAAARQTMLQPVEHLWAPIPRLVRDLALAAGKEVEVTLDGSATELDRGQAEAVKAPLTHLLRNAVDHGIERPEEREAAGKERTGRLDLRARCADGVVVLEVSDDGRGIDRERVRAEATALGLLPGMTGPLEAAVVYELLFESGLSTARRVSALSGRGVGLDIVRSEVSRIGGRVEIDSEPGQGTTFRIVLPASPPPAPTRPGAERGA